MYFVGQANVTVMQSNWKSNFRKRNWSQLQDDICRKIVEKLRFYCYHRKFATACRDWYRITMEMFGPFRKNSLFLLLPYDKKNDTATLYQISNSEVISFNVPELHDKWIHGSSHGWLATTDIDLHIILVNPLTRAQILLPEPTDLLETLDTYSWLTVLGQHHPHTRNEHMMKFVLSGSPSFSKNCVVATIMTTFKRLFVCGLGDATWTRLILKPRTDTYDRNVHLHDVIFFREKIYATVRDGQYMIIVDYDEHNFHARYVSGPKIEYSENNIGVLSGNFVECSGDLLMVLKCGHVCNEEPPKTVLFELYRFEKETEKWSKIQKIGEKCLFLGASASISVSAAEVPGCKPNCIYYLDHFHEGRLEEHEFGYEVDNGVFSLENNSINAFNISNSKVWPLPAVWYRQNI